MYAVLFFKYIVMHGVMPHVYFSEHAQFWGVASCCAPCMADLMLNPCVNIVRPSKRDTTHSCTGQSGSATVSYHWQTLTNHLNTAVKVLAIDTLKRLYSFPYMYDGLHTGAHMGVDTGVCANMYGLTYRCTYARRRYLFLPVPYTGIRTPM